MTTMNRGTAHRTETYPAPARDAEVLPQALGLSWSFPNLDSPGRSGNDELILTIVTSPWGAAELQAWLVSGEIRRTVLAPMAAELQVVHEAGFVHVDTPADCRVSIHMTLRDEEVVYVSSNLPRLARLRGGCYEAARRWMDLGLASR